MYYKIVHCLFSGMPIFLPFLIHIQAPLTPTHCPHCSPQPPYQIAACLSGSVSPVQPPTSRWECRDKFSPLDPIRMATSCEYPYSSDIRVIIGSSDHQCITVCAQCHRCALGSPSY